MKKLFTLFCLVATVCVAFAQSNHAVDASVKAKLKPAPHATKPIFHNGSNRAATTSFLLDYDGNDNQYSTNMGYTYSGYLWGVNKKYGNTDNLNMGYAAVSFDTLQYLDQSNNITFIPRAQATLTLDSFVVAFIHQNTTGHNDSIHFTVFNTSSKVVSGYGTPTATFTTPILWDTLIVTNSTIPLNTTNYTFLTFAPNISLPQGKTFGVRVDFSGDTANKFNMVAGYRDQCAGACAAEISVAGNNSAYYLNLTTSTGTNLSGYFENDGQGAIYYDCDNSGGFTTGGCENFYVQNWWIFAYESASVNYGAVIIADSLKGCPGTTLNLNANAFGSNATPFTYSWATSSGTLTSTTDQQVGLVIGSSNATVTVTVTDANNLTTTATVTVQSKGVNISITNANPLTINCGANATLTTQISGSTTGKNYTWSTGATGTTQATLSVNAPGTYSVTVTNNSGCSASASIAVQYPGGLGNNVAFTNPPAPICQGRPLTFTNTTARQTGWTPQWSFGDGNLGFTADGTNTYANPGVYTVTLSEDSAGCTFSKTGSVTVLASTNAACISGIEDVTFANAISMMPNPSNGNINFIINGVEKNVTIHVYNVIGSEVKTFVSSDVASTFSKTFDFSDLANGTYLVKIQSADKTAVKRLTISK